MNMLDDSEHGSCVDAWFERAAKGVPVEQLIAEFEAAFTALWRRAHQTLGDVTLAAIADRVLYVAAEQHPAMSALELDVTGVRWDVFRQRAATLPPEQLVEGVRFVLIEFLTVLGKLTGEVLSAPLHAQLTGQARGATSADEASEPAQTASSRINGEDRQP
jgi:hypothetical protein